VSTSGQTTNGPKRMLLICCSLGMGEDSSKGEEKTYIQLKGKCHKLLDAGRKDDCCGLVTNRWNSNFSLITDAGTLLPTDTLHTHFYYPSLTIIQLILSHPQSGTLSPHAEVRGRASAVSRGSFRPHPHEHGSRPSLGTPHSPAPL
jgi:hypothetical protein